MQCFLSNGTKYCGIVRSGPAQRLTACIVRWPFRFNCFRLQDQNSIQIERLSIDASKFLVWLEVLENVGDGKQAAHNANGSKSRTRPLQAALGEC